MVISVTKTGQMNKRQFRQKWNGADKREALRKIREIAGVSLSELAILAGLSESMLSKYELGHRDLSFNALVRLQKAVNVITSRKDEEDKRRDLIERATSKEMGQLLGKFIPLRAVGDEKYARDLRERQAAMEREYGPHWKEVFGALFEQGQQNRELEKRLADVRDLLRLETEAALKESERDEKREQILKRVPSAESKE